jgi:hypothetical protein
MSKDLVQIKIERNPNPKPAARLDAERADDAPAVRRLNCRYYDRCLDVADVQNWPGFTCNGCDAFVPIDAEQERCDLVGMVEMLIEAGIMAPPDGEEWTFDDPDSYDADRADGADDEIEDDLIDPIARRAA